MHHSCKPLYVITAFWSVIFLVHILARYGVL